MVGGGGCVCVGVGGWVGGETTRNSHFRNGVTTVKDPPDPRHIHPACTFSNISAPMESGPPTGPDPSAPPPPAAPPPLAVWPPALAPPAASPAAADAVRCTAATRHRLRRSEPSTRLNPLIDRATVRAYTTHPADDPPADTLRCTVRRTSTLAYLNRLDRSPASSLTGGGGVRLPESTG